MVRYASVVKSHSPLSMLPPGHTVQVPAVTRMRKGSAALAQLPSALVPAVLPAALCPISVCQKDGLRHRQTATPFATRCDRAASAGRDARLSQCVLNAHAAAGMASALPRPQQR